MTQGSSAPRRYGSSSQYSGGRSSSSGGSRTGPRSNDKDRPSGGRGRGFFPRRRVCHFCVDKIEFIDFKEVSRLSRYVSDRGRIQPRRRSGVCARHQRALSTAIKRARHMALLPFTLSHIRESGMSFGPPPRVGPPRDRRPYGAAPPQPQEQAAPPEQAASAEAQPAGAKPSP